MQENFFKRLTSAHLKRAADLKTQMERLETELTTLLGIPSALKLSSVIKRKNTVSAAVRAKISQAAKARWAKIRADKNVS